LSWLAWRLHGTKVRFAAGVGALAVLVVVASRIVLSSGASQDLKVWASIPTFEVLLLVIVAPALLGMFLGAPLVATELEGGLHRLAWAQSVSRRRWLLSHTALVLGGAAVVMAAVGAAMYWCLPSVASDVPLDPAYFDSAAIVPAAYGAFAVALGVALGALTRRTLVAMFLVLVLFAAVRVGIEVAARPNYQSPLHAVTAMSAIKVQGKGASPGSDGESVPASAYVLDQRVLDASGRAVDVSVGAANCLAADCDRYRVATDYQPADRFWTFQLVEAGIYAALTALLLGLTYWRVVRLT
jgi:hypothetical protein